MQLSCMMKLSLLKCMKLMIFYTVICLYKLRPERSEDNNYWIQKRLFMGRCDRSPSGRRYLGC